MENERPYQAGIEASLGEGSRVKLRRLVRSAAFLSLLLVLGVQQAVVAQQQTGGKRPLVVLTRLSSPGNSVIAQKLADTITSSVDLVLRLTGTMNVRRADYLVPMAFFDRAMSYYNEVGADGAVFGMVTPDANGTYTVEVEIWRRTSARTQPILLKRRVSNPLSSFDLSDQISLDVASTVVGRQLTEGTLRLENVHGLKNYAVYADGHLLGRNRTTFRVLAGKRTIILAKHGLLGDEPVQIFHVDIAENGTTIVTMKSKARTAKTSPKPSAVGAVTVHVTDPGTLFVDGVEHAVLAEGETVTIERLKMGIHSLEIKYPDGSSEIRMVTLSAVSPSSDVAFKQAVPEVAIAQPAGGVTKKTTKKNQFRYIMFMYNPYFADFHLYSVPAYSLVYSTYRGGGGHFGLEAQVFGSPKATTASANFGAGGPTAEPGVDLVGIAGWGGNLFGRHVSWLYGDLDALSGLVWNATDKRVQFLIGLEIGPTLHIGPVAVRVDIPFWAVMVFPLVNFGIEYDGIEFGAGVAL